MIKKGLILIFIFIFIVEAGYCQTDTNMFGIDNNTSLNSYIIPVGGVFFFPYSINENQHDSLTHYCVGLEKAYFINDLLLNEKQFLSLKLKQKFVIEKHGKYYYQYSWNDCVEKIKFVVSVNLAIEFYKGNCKLQIEPKYPAEIKVISIKRKNYLFKKDKLIAYIE